jgi:S1 RNA binding domain protein
MPVVVGEILEGKVTGITKFGAFVELDGGTTGLVHISEVADSFVKDVNDYLKHNDKVKVKVIGISEDGKVSLSIRKTKDPEDDQRRSRESMLSFEDKLAKFMKDSEERLLDARRSADAKRGSGGYGRRRGF